MQQPTNTAYIFAILSTAKKWEGIHIQMFTGYVSTAFCHDWFACTFAGNLSGAIISKQPAYESNLLFNGKKTNAHAIMHQEISSGFSVPRVGVKLTQKSISLIEIELYLWYLNNFLMYAYITLNRTTYCPLKWNLEFLEKKVCFRAACIPGSQV